MIRFDGLYKAICNKCSAVISQALWPNDLEFDDADECTSCKSERQNRYDELLINY